MAWQPRHISAVGFWTFRTTFRISMPEAGPAGSSPHRDYYPSPFVDHLFLNGSLVAGHGSKTINVFIIRLSHAGCRSGLSTQAGMTAPPAVRLWHFAFPGRLNQGQPVMLCRLYWLPGETGRAGRPSSPSPSLRSAEVPLAIDNEGLRPSLFPVCHDIRGRSWYLRIFRSRIHGFRCRPCCSRK